MASFERAAMISRSAEGGASDVAGLHREGELSLNAFLDECAQRGIEPRKRFSGKFVPRVAPEIHEAAVIAAAASGESLNQRVADAIKEAMHA